MSLQIAVSKAAATTSSAVPTADSEFEKLTDPTKPAPTPPVHAARLSALLKSLANAEGAVSESIKARRGLIEGLEKIIEANRSALTAEESQGDVLNERKAAIEAKKREVEDGIMRGLSADSTPAAHGSPFGDPRSDGKAATLNDSAEPERPHVEELTPPPPEAITPAGSPIPGTTGNNPGSTAFGQQPVVPEPLPSSQQLSAPAPAGSDLLSSLSMPPVRHYAGSPGNVGGGLTKKRKLDDDYPDFGSGEDGMADLDEDVAELLRAESGGAH